MVTEYKLHELLPGSPWDARLGASGVLCRNGNYYLVFENRKEVAFLPKDLRLPHIRNSLLSVARHEEGYQGIAFNHHKRRFQILAEPARKKDKGRGSVVEAEHTADGLLSMKERPLDFDSQSCRSGFAALEYLTHGGENHLLALCKGNRGRKGAAGRVPGGGRILVFRKTRRRWTRPPGKSRRIKLPESLRFPDYSAMSFYPEKKRFAILSKENSEMWVGTFDQDRWDWTDPGRIYQFPRGERGEALYGNLNGVAWINHERVVVVSGRRNSKEPVHFGEKDQSIHIFDLPHPAS